MKYKFFLVLFVSFLFAVSAKQADASLLTIDKEGNLNWKVLSYDSSLALDVPGDRLYI